VKIIKVLGTGCQKCEKLKQDVEKAVNELGLECRIEKVDKITDIINYGVMMTPGLVIDEQVICSGRVPSMEELKKLIG